MIPLDNAISYLPETDLRRESRTAILEKESADYLDASMVLPNEYVGPYCYKHH
jgi:hypothetical protein